MTIEPSQKPNSEQQIAINSLQGGLLSAGAGSGKTFVIVHHVFFLFKNILNRELSQNIAFDIKEKNIARSISQIVIMTFTRKAAGDIKAKIKKELDKKLAYTKLQNDPEYDSWKIIESYFDYVTIGTIDSFCSKVLKSGIITKIDSQFSVVDQFQKNWELERIVKEELKKLVIEKEVYKSIITIRYQDIISSFGKIFSDTLIRWTWEKHYQDNLAQFITKDQFEQLLVFYQAQDFWGYEIDDAIINEYQDKKWFEGFYEVHQMSKSKSLYDLDTLENVMTSLKKIDRFTAPRGKKHSSQIIEYSQHFKNFRTCLEKHIGENIIESLKQSQNSNSELCIWWEIFQNLFPRVLKKYEQISELSFSDLNITLLKSLNDKEVLKRLSIKYQYFIIDEFQDTSQIQYEIVRKIVKEDYSKIFAVGDRKQAIYGFRGGELEVFNHCEKNTHFSHSLLNNYRSKELITSFNNTFFKQTMNLGIGWKGDDNYPVVFEEQETPNIGEYKGAVELLKVHNEESWDWEQDYTFSQLESSLFIERIKQQIQQEPDSSIVVLYSKIKLSFDLVEKLISNEIDFTAQVNLELDEEPILELLKIFLIKEKKIEKEDYFNLMYLGILSKLNLQSQINSEKAFEFFIEQKKFWGIKISFYKTLIKIGVSLSSIDYNLGFFDKVIEECRADEDKILSLLKSRQLGRHKMNLKQGRQASRINIMTSHASKGLEFDLVLLGGIYLNGPRLPDRELLGKWPGSIQWFKDHSQKKKYKTPQYMLEMIEKKEKEFSERKRLFYVATTRAKNQLAWCDFPVDKVSSQDNAWFKPLKMHLDSFTQLSTKREYTIELNKSGASKIFKKSELPLFHRDTLGITQRLGESSLDFGIFPEISVTSLSSLVLCPKKFYLSQILKISYKELQKFKLIDETIEKKEKSSSLSRGIKLHEAVERYLKGESITRELFDVNWLSSLLASFPKDSWSYKVEQLHKFDLLGYMMTGIPDLIMHSKDSITIWDFKTGDIEDSSQEAYWFQLMLYAWIYKESFSKIEISLVYLDEKKILTRNVTRVDLFEKVDFYLSKMKNLFHKEDQHCQECIYNLMCNAKKENI